jgi:hypothetical protein
MDIKVGDIFRFNNKEVIEIVEIDEDYVGYVYLTGKLKLEHYMRKLDWIDYGLIKVDTPLERIIFGVDK